MNIFILEICFPLVDNFIVVKKHQSNITRADTVKYAKFSRINGTTLFQCFNFLSFRVLFNSKCEREE
jgi:hypothetical protein